MSQLKSSRALSDKDLINNAAESAIVSAQVNLSEDLKIILLKKGSKKIYVNDNLLKKQSDIRNYIRTVCFSSSDINIVRGEPSFRRIWLDKVVSQLEPVYVELISRFNKLLKQRSHFWRSGIYKKYQSDSLLDSFDEQMSIIGTRIFRRRKRALARLKPFIEYRHNYLSKSKEKIGFNYLGVFQNFSDEKSDEQMSIIGTRIFRRRKRALARLKPFIEYRHNYLSKSKEKIAFNYLGVFQDFSDEKSEEQTIIDEFCRKLREQRKLEEITGKCVIGPHRDDIEFLINDSSVRKYASSGQQRTITLALKMAEMDLLRKSMSIKPILILDDVLAELDVVRQNLLLDSVGNDSQCFISATHLDKFNDLYLDDSQIIYL